MYIKCSLLAALDLLASHSMATIALGIRNLPDANGGEETGRDPTSTFAWFDGEFPCGGPSLGTILSNSVDFCASGPFTLHNRVFEVDGCDGGDDVRLGLSSALQVFEFVKDGSGNLVKTFNSTCRPMGHDYTFDCESENTQETGTDLMTLSYLCS